jgi:hypothetical protein
MSFTSLNPELLLGFMVVLALFFVLILRLNNKHKELQQQEALRRQVRQFRLYKMLLYLGVNFDSYIRILPGEAILNHATNCSACPNIPTCDKCLFDGKIMRDMNFCPNYQSLTYYSRYLERVS